MHNEHDNFTKLDEHRKHRDSDIETLQSTKQKQSHQYRILSKSMWLTHHISQQAERKLTFDSKQMESLAMVDNSHKHIEPEPGYC